MRAIRGVCVCPSLAAGSLWFLAQFRLRMDPSGLSNRGVTWLGNLVRYQMYLSTVCLQIHFFCDPAAIVSRELKVHVSLLALRSRCLDDYFSRQKDDRNHGETFLYVGLEFVVMDCITHSIQQKSRIFVCIIPL